MLKLGRREGEAITMFLPNGDKIEFELTKYKGLETTVGVSAPENVTILRNELLDEDKNTIK